MITIGVVGVGHWGPNLIRNFHGGSESRVRWICDTDQRRLAQVQARFGDIPVTTEVEDVLADPSVDAVVVATPTSTHHAISRAALQAGKDVLVEKPVTARAVEAQELAELCESSGRLLMVGHVFLYNEGVRRVRRYLQDDDARDRALHLHGAHQPGPDPQ